MKQSIVVFVVAGSILTSCISSNEPTLVVPEDQLAEIQARCTLIIATDVDYEPQSKLLPNVLPRPDTICEPSQYQNLDLTQEAAQFDLASLNQVS